MAVLSDSEREFLKMTRAKTKVKPWTNAEWQRFWGVAKGDLGLTEDEVHETFGAPSMKDVNMMCDDAIAHLRAVVDGEVADAEADFPPPVPEDDPQPPTREAASLDVEPVAAWYGDAPASVCIGTYGPGGFDVQWTIRDVETDALVKRVTGLLQWLPKHGYRPKYGNNGPRAQASGNGAQPSGDAPVCNAHNRKMRVSDWDKTKWHCTFKLADGSYCTETEKVNS